MNITFAEPLSRAWERTRRMLFEPFELVKWLVLGFSVWLANLVSTKAPRVTLEGLKEQLEKPRFANATREDLPGLPGMEALKL